MRGITEIDEMLAASERELARLDDSRRSLMERIETLRRERERISRTVSESTGRYHSAPVNVNSGNLRDRPVRRLV